MSDKLRPAWITYRRKAKGGSSPCIHFDDPPGKCFMKENTQPRIPDMGLIRDQMSLIMDLSCVHEKRPLRLSALREATPGDFAHDVAGIIVHLDREKGELPDTFSPRFEAPATAEA